MGSTIDREFLTRPKFSILTATAGRDTLCDLYQSLVDQIYQNWEWIIVFDGARAYNPIIKKFNDKRIRWKIYDYPFHAFGRPQRVEACKLAIGEWIIYIDDDDILKPNCLETVNRYTKNHDFILWKVYADWLKRAVPHYTTDINRITCGDICSNSYAIRIDLAKSNPWPITQKRDWAPGVAVDFYWFSQIRLKLKKPILLMEVLAVARHDYRERKKPKQWMSIFGH